MKPQDGNFQEEILNEIREVKAKLDLLTKNLPIISRAVSDSEIRKFEKRKKQMREKATRKFVGLEHWLLRTVTTSKKHDRINTRVNFPNPHQSVGKTI